MFGNITFVNNYVSASFVIRWYVFILDCC